MHAPLLITRRTFLRRSSLATAGTVFLTTRAGLRAAGANDRLRVAVMGTNGRGMAHIENFLSLPNVEVAYVCDVDSRAVDKAVAAVTKKQPAGVKGVKDFRTALEDKTVDLLSIAAPNHWHAPATSLACAAGKHVYVEKPGSHNPKEGEWMAAAARKHRRVVQMGNQRRSMPWMQEAMAMVREGLIGKVTFARCWYNNSRGSIGRGKSVPVPEWLDYTLWQGPAPERPYQDNLIHYNWHWRWHWGGGELANNGVHALDIARWGLGVDYPLSVCCGGGRYQFEDDQETPDIYITTYDFGGKGASWESHSCHPRGFEGSGFGVTFYGDRGSLVIAGNTVKHYEPGGKELKTVNGRGSELEHFRNFVDCVRGGGKPSAEIEDGQRSTLLCHLGNIAYRTGKTVRFDPTSRRIVDDRTASALWQREYRRGWQPRV